MIVSTVHKSNSRGLSLFLNLVDYLLNDVTVLLDLVLRDLQGRHCDEAEIWWCFSEVTEVQVIVEL